MLGLGKCFPGAFVGAPLGLQFLVVPGGLAGGTMYVVHILIFHWVNGSVVVSVGIAEDTRFYEKSWYAMTRVEIVNA